MASFVWTANTVSLTKIWSILIWKKYPLIKNELCLQNIVYLYILVIFSLSLLLYKGNEFNLISSVASNVLFP